MTNPSIIATGRLLFILDGFDEMATQADSHKVRQNIQLFEELANIPNNKVLLTTRPEYFVRPGEDGEILKKYERLYLQPFRPTEIKQYLRKRLGSKQAECDWARICEIYDLPDLAERPVFLEMIVKTLPKFRDNEQVSHPKLYEKYLRGELERQREKQRPDLKIGDNKRFEIMEELALAFHQTGRFQAGLNESEVHQLFKDNPILSQEERGYLERTTRDILTCSFLINPRGNYYFSHKSFQEFLLARCLRWALQANDRSDFARQELSIPTLEFLAEMLEADRNGTIAELEIAKSWLEETTATPGANGEVEFGPLQQNVAGLLLAQRVLTLPLGQVSGYLTCAEYQLFVEEQQKMERYYQPAHWIKYHFLPGQALALLRGVGYREAVRFCSWLDNRHKGSFDYRLPPGTSVPLTGFEDLATWTLGGKLAGLTQIKASELQAQLEQITNFRNLDLARGLALGHSFDLALARTRGLDSNFDRFPGFDRDIARFLDRFLALDSAPDLARFLARDLTFDRQTDRFPGLDRDYDGWICQDSELR